MNQRYFNGIAMIGVFILGFVLFFGGCTIVVPPESRPNLQENSAVKPQPVPVTVEEWLQRNNCQQVSKSDYLYRKFTVNWKEEEIGYVAEVLLQGREGVMRVWINEDNAIDQEFVYADCPDGKWFVGFNPVDYETRQPVRYEIDNFRLRSTPNGKWTIEHCSDLFFWYSIGKTSK
jgi:hypothetical protein